MSIPVIPFYTLPSAHDLPENRVQWKPDTTRAVLLIHDMQEYFLRFYGPDNPLVHELIANISAIRRWAKAAGIPVVYTAQPAEQNPQDRALLNDMWGPGLTKADPALKAVVAALQPEPDDTVLVKWRYSAFQRSSLQQLMQAWQRDQLLIVGVYAHIGCMTTALDAFMRDIQPFMISDGVADFTEQEHHMALNYVAGRCGAVLSMAQLLETTGSTASPALPVMNREQLRQLLLSYIDEDDSEFGEDDNLMDYGLDSVQVMGLVAEWEKYGVKVTFEELARKPSLNAWWTLYSQKQAA